MFSASREDVVTDLILAHYFCLGSQNSSPRSQSLLWPQNLVVGYREMSGVSVPLTDEATPAQGGTGRARPSPEASARLLTAIHSPLFPSSFQY